MPATPGQIRRPVIVNHTVDFGDGVSVKFVYDRNKITDAWMNEWSALEEQADVSKLNETMDDLILSWDVVNEDGSPFPKTAENIGYLFALPDKGRIFQELVTASTPTRAEGNVSPEPSNTPQSDSAPPQPTPQNGPAPSASATVSASPSPT